MNKNTNTKHTIKCPNCKKNISITLGDILKSKKVICPNCKTPVQLQGKELSKKLEEIEKLTKKLFNKKITIKL